MSCMTRETYPGDPLRYFRHQTMPSRQAVLRLCPRNRGLAREQRLGRQADVHPLICTIKGQADHDTSDVVQLF